MLQIKSKKLLLGICFFVLFITSSFAQLAGDYRSAANGLWSNTATWQRFDGAAWVATLVIPSSTDGVITIRTGHLVTISAANVLADQIVVESTGILSVLTPRVLTVNNGAGTDLQIDAGGTVRCNTGTATLTINASANVINNGTLLQTVPTAIINNNGIITNSGTITSTSAANFRFLAGSKYEHSFLAASGTIPSSTWNATSTCEILACLGPGAGPSGLNQSFGHFIWNNTGQAAGDINFAGLFTGTQVGSNFTVASTGLGRLVMKGTNAGGTTVGGSFFMTGGSLVLTNGAVGFPNSNMTLNITGAYSQSGGTVVASENPGSTAGANGNGTISVGTTTTLSGGTLTLTNSPSTTSAAGNGTLTSTGNLLISGGTLNMCTSSGSGSIGSGGSAIITANGTFTMSSGTLNTTSSTRTIAGGNATITSTGLMTLSGGTLNGSTSTGALPGAIVIINANAGLTVSGATVNLTPGSVTGGGGSGTINVTGAMVFSAGTINVNSSTAAGTTFSNGSIAVSTTCAISGTATLNLASGSTTGGGGNGTLTVTGAFTQSGGAITLCSSSGAGTFANGLLDLNSTCTISGGTINLTSATRTGGGGTGTINVAGNFTHTTASTAFTRTSAVAAATGTINIDGTGAQVLRSTNGFNIGNIITFNVSQNPGTATIPIAFLVSQGTTFNLNDNTAITTDLTVSGVFNVSGIMNVNTSAVLDMGTVVMSNAIVATGGFFNLIGSSGLITKHAQGITTLATGAFGCIQVTGGRAYSAGADYTYNSSTAAQVTGNGLPTSLTGSSNLTISNTFFPSPILSNGGVTLTQATSTVGTLTLTSQRLITTSVNLMTLDAGAISSPGFMTTQTNFSFVDGPIKKIGNTSFIYPTGDIYNLLSGTMTAKWARIEIAAPTAISHAFTAEYHKLDDPCDVNQAVSNSNGLGIDHVSYKEYWDLTRVTGTSTPVVKLYWENNSQATSIGSAISSATTTNLHVAEFDGGMWNDRGAAGIVTAGITGNISTSTVTTFTTGTIMPFTFSGPTAVNPLPVEILTFNGLSTVAGNQLFWSTATETNNDYFSLERSIDGAEFTSIAKIKGNGNSTSTKNYEYLDTNPFNELNYYRLKQVDFDGNYSYSTIISIENNFNESPTIQVFPNPSQDIVNIVTSDNFSTIAIYNMLGELVFSSATNQNVIQFKPLADGLYVVKATTKTGKEITSRFIKN